MCAALPFCDTSSIAPPPKFSSRFAVWRAVWTRPAVITSRPFRARRPTDAALPAPPYYLLLFLSFFFFLRCAFSPDFDVRAISHSLGASGRRPCCCIPLSVLKIVNTQSENEGCSSHPSPHPSSVPCPPRGQQRSLDQMWRVRGEARLERMKPTRTCVVHVARGPRHSFTRFSLFFSSLYSLKNNPQSIFNRKERPLLLLFVDLETKKRKQNEKKKKKETPADPQKELHSQPSRCRDRHHVAPISTAGALRHIPIIRPSLRFFRFRGPFTDDVRALLHRTFPHLRARNMCSWTAKSPTSLPAFRFLNLRFFFVPASLFFPRNAARSVLRL